MPDNIADVHKALASIHAAWREGRPSSMLEYLHPDIAMALPGFVGTIQGRDALIAGFDDFCQNAKVLEYEESDENISVIGDCAIATFRFRMLYERSGYCGDSRGRDLWVFHKQEGRWIAVWRTLLDMTEERS